MKGSSGIADVEELVFGLADEEGERGAGLEFGRCDGDFALGLVEAEGLQVGGGILQHRRGLKLAEAGEHVGDFADIGGAFGRRRPCSRAVVGAAGRPFLAPMGR